MFNFKSMYRVVLLLIFCVVMFGCDNGDNPVGPSVGTPTVQTEPQQQDGLSIIKKDVRIERTYNSADSVTVELFVGVQHTGSSALGNVDYGWELRGASCGDSGGIIKLIETTDNIDDTAAHDNRLVGNYTYTGCDMQDGETYTVTLDLIEYYKSSATSNVDPMLVERMSVSFTI